MEQILDTSSSESPLPGQNPTEIVARKPLSAQVKDYFKSLAGILTILATVVIVIIAFCAGTVIGRIGSDAAPSVADGGQSVPVATSAAPTGPTVAASTGAPTPDGSTAPASTTLPSNAPGSGTNLAALKPVQSTQVYYFVAGPEQVGTTVYQNSVRFTCGGEGNIVFNVAGANALVATLGVPNDATNAAGNTMVVTFFKGAITSTTQIGTPYSVALDKPKSVNIALTGVSQLVIMCSATNTAHQRVTMDITLGDAVLN